MSKLREWLSEGPLITDGAWGTQLLALGLAPGALPDAWNIERPEAVESVALAYVDAGSQVILTNTFRSNRITLEAAGLAGQLDDINRAGVEISKRAAAGKSLVFASIGPSGKLLMNGEVGRLGARLGRPSAIPALPRRLRGQRPAGRNGCHAPR